MTDQRRLNILLVDDHRLVADGVSSLLRSATFRARVGRETQVDTAESVLNASRRLDGDHCYDLVLIDLAMPEASGFDLLRQLQQRDAPVLSIVLSGSFNGPDILRAQKLGANGFISKFESSGKLIAKIAAVVEGGQCFPASSARPQGVDIHEEAAGISVTPRQREVLELMATGYTNKEIARQLEVSIATVKFHVADLFRQLQVKNRTLCVREAIRRGIISQADRAPETD